MTDRTERPELQAVWQCWCSWRGAEGLKVQARFAAPCIACPDCGGVATGDVTPAPVQPVPHQFVPQAVPLNGALTQCVHCGTSEHP